MNVSSKAWWAKGRGLYFHVTNVLKQSRRLLVFLIWGTHSWLIALIKLLIYVLILMPGWLHMCWYYFTSKNIKRNIEYGKGHMHRNLLDVYLPINVNNAAKVQSGSAVAAAPVIIFFSGGAWIIGYKLWSAIIARGFSACGYVTIVPDYRNFPQGDILSMTEDVRSVLLWVHGTVGAYGGDPCNVVLCGQSAGAHIAMTTLLDLFNVIRASQASGKASNCDVCGEAAPSAVDLTTAHADRLCRTSDSAAAHTDADDCDSVEYYVSPSKGENSTPQQDIEIGCDSGHSLTLSLPSLDLELDQDYIFDSDVNAVCRGTLDNGASQPLHINSQSSGITTSDSLACTAADHSIPTGVVKEHHVDAVLAEFLLQRVRRVVLVNAPTDLVSLVSHCHSRGLDSSILHWICRDDLAAYSPTCMVRSFGKEEEMASTRNKAAMERLWERFPPVSIFSCSNDCSIPLSQGRELFDALRGIAKNALSLQHWVYTNKSHTSLIVEDPLVGDFSLVFDIHRILSAIDRPSGHCEITSHSDRNAAPHRLVESFPTGAKEVTEREFSPFDDNVIQRARSDLHATVHPALVAIARQMNPF